MKRLSLVKMIALVVVLILVGAAAWAQGSGQKLHDLWVAYQQIKAGNADFTADMNGGTYIGYVMGTARVMNDAGWISLPSNSSGEQWVAVVGNYLDATPEQWTQRAEVLTYRALYAAWPGKVAPPSGYR